MFPSTFAIALILHALLGWDIIEALMFGSMVGGETTAAVMIPLSRSLNLSQMTTAFLTLESAMNSIFSIVLFFAFLGFYKTGTANPLGALSSIASNFSGG
jgi:NhaP-type Na+/H+ or K+/H+ antiporter